MKKYKKVNEIHVIGKKPLPDDFEEIKKELLSSTHKEEAIVNIGKNRGQFFIRIPSRISNMILLTEKDKIKITAESGGKEANIKLEIIRGEEDETS